jgi:hypothetical protein
MFCREGYVSGSFGGMVIGGMGTDKTCSTVLFGEFGEVGMAVLEPGNCFFNDLRASIALKLDCCRC